MDPSKPFTPDMITTILNRLDEQDRTMARNHAENKDALAQIVGQVVRTNGRVTALEKWRYTIAGGLAVIVLLIGWYAAMHPAGK